MINFERLANYSSEELFSFGFKIYQDFGKYTLLLVPAKFYNKIPDGTEFVNTEQLLVIFKRGITPSAERFGLLGFGVLVKL